MDRPNSGRCKKDLSLIRVRKEIDVSGSFVTITAALRRYKLRPTTFNLAYRPTLFKTINDRILLND